MGVVSAVVIVGVGDCVSNVIVTGVDASLLLFAVSIAIPAGIDTVTVPSETRSRSKVYELPVPTNSDIDATVSSDISISS